MIFNLSKFISDNSSVVPVTSGFSPAIEGDTVELNQTGGGDGNTRGLKVDYSVQLKSRSEDRVTAYELIQTVFNLLSNRFNIELPEVTVKSKAYPAGKLYPTVIAWQILPVQEPGYLGTDENRLHEWSVNFRVTIRRQIVCQE